MEEQINQMNQSKEEIEKKIEDTALESEVAVLENAEGQDREGLEEGKKGEEVQKREPAKNSPLKEFLSWVRIIVIAVAIAYLVNNFVIINANVPSGSMEKTIMTKDRMIGLRTAYWFGNPKRGDIVIFKFPDDESQTFVKRVIGLPGEKVVIKNAKIYINDATEPLDEPYLPEEWTKANGSDVEMEYKVPENSYFVLGDNRNISHDARFWTNTYVKSDQIIAKAEFVYWPWGHKGLLKSADYAE